MQGVDTFDPITNNKVSNFSLLRNKAKVKKDGNVITLDIDRKIFSKLIVVSQTRDFDLKKLFEFELSSVPLALFNPDGSMRKCTKSEFLKEIESGLAVEEIDIVPGSSAVIIDFMVLVRMVCTDTSKCKTFGELSETLLSIIFGLYTVASRIDVVCDRYDVSDSIKAAERAKRRTVDMQEIAIHNENTPLLNKELQSNSRNKANIVEFLYRHWIDKGSEKLTALQKLTLAGGFKDGREAMILTKQSASLSPELHSDHEEADSRMFVHVEHAKQADSASRIIIWSIDTDVAVICPRIVKALNIEELYFITGTKQRKRYIPMHLIHDKLGNDISVGLPNLHALSVCDSNSTLSGHGKKAVLKVAKSNPGLVCRLNENFGIDPQRVTDDAVSACLEFASLIYTGTEFNTDLSKMRRDLFEKKQLVSDKLPPTFPEFNEHMKRANYPAFIWNNATVAMMNLPTPIGNGWSRDDDVIICPTRMIKPPAPEGFVELTVCRCKTTCSTNKCSCRKNGLLCSGACYCESSACENTEEAYSDSEDSESDYSSD